MMKKLAGLLVFFVMFSIVSPFFSNSLTAEGYTNDVIPPSKPANVHYQDVSYNSVKLNWSPSIDNIGVVSYDVYNGNGLLGTVSSVTYSVYELIPNATYNITIKARDAAGNVSVPSDLVSFTTLPVSQPLALLGSVMAPQNVRVLNHSGTSVSLAWDAVTDGGVTSYEVYNGNSLAGTSTETGYMVNGLTGGETYTFTVKAKNTAGNTSPASDSVNVRAIGEVLRNGGFETYVSGPTAAEWVLDQDTGVTSTGGSNTTTVWEGTRAQQISASGTVTDSSSWIWQTANVAANQSYKMSGRIKIESLTQAKARFYAFFLDANENFLDWTYVDYTEVTSGYQNAQLIGTTPANTAKVRVYVGLRGVNNAWTGSMLVDDMHFQVLDLTAAPVKPTNVKATGVTGTSVSLAWDAVTDGGVTSYEIYNGNSLAGTSTETGYTASGLTGGETYTFTVKAKNALGSTSPASDPISARAIGEVLRNGGFETYVSGPTAAEWVLDQDTGVTSTGGSNTTTVWEGTYAQQISASGTVTDSSTWIWQTANVAANQSYKMSGRIKIDSLTQAKARFYAFFLDANENFLDWTYVDYTEVTSGYQNAQLIGTTPANTAKVRVYVGLRGVNNAWTGNMLVDDMHFQVMDLTAAPVKPTNVKATGVTGTSVSLAWDAVTDGGVTSYEVYNGNSLAGTSTETGYMVNGLTGGETYTFTVKAKNTAGNTSPASDPISARAIGEVLRNGGFETYVSGPTAAEWVLDQDTGVTSTGGSNTTTVWEGTYAQQISASGTVTDSSTWIWQTANVAANQSYKMSGRIKIDSLTQAKARFYAFFLDANENFLDWTYVDYTEVTSGYQNAQLIGTTPANTAKVRVYVGLRGVNNAWTGSMLVDDMHFQVLDLTAAPVKPTNVKATGVTGTSVSLAWDAVTDGGVTSYEIYNGNSLAGTSTETGYMVNGLTGGETYTFTVKAKNALGSTSPASDSVNVRAIGEVLRNGGFETYVSGPTAAEWVLDQDTGVTSTGGSNTTTV
ncbi:fibronectin type III domain-containing protein, partial [Paenibacillus periandrae]|uniref:fibronectin type III domain-containing protein n=1 Tax=Paenibacillus periandrae TaxID=1761741 RepID=UPI001F097D25